jgi:integrase
MIREAVQSLYRRGRAIRTIKLAFAVLHRCFDAAMEDGYLTANPTPKFKKLHLGEGERPADSAKRHALSAAQSSALLAACARDPELQLWVSVGMSTGLRPGEITALRKRDIDLKRGIIHVRGSAKKVYGAPGEGARLWIGKTKTPSSMRDVGIGPALTALIASHFERMEAMQRQLRALPANVATAKALVPDDACMFCHDATTPDGLRLPRSPFSLSHQFKVAAKRAGLPSEVSGHWLRHTAISHALDEGTSLADASKRAGHSNPATTAAIYTHAVNEGDQRAAMIGDSLLGPHTVAELAQLPAKS